MNSAAPEAPTPVGDELDGAACAACAHPIADHDALGRRFCAATEAAAIPRGCICRP